ncbi:MAG: MerR family transcriptional regulator [Comamonadaceae bacterium]|nr:MAG: MerR family transcriptional regulator [Comamonadaceae bacterium]
MVYTLRPVRAASSPMRRRSVYTIRWYEAQGLLPLVPRQSGQRVYSRRHLEWLELMEHLRGSGMPVAQLREYTRLAQQGGATLLPTLAVLTAHKALVEERLAQWQEALAIVEGKIAFYRGWIDTGRRPAPIHGETRLTRPRPATRTAPRPR